MWLVARPVALPSILLQGMQNTGHKFEISTVCWRTSSSGWRLLPQLWQRRENAVNVMLKWVLGHRSCTSCNYASVVSSLVYHTTTAQGIWITNTNNTVYFEQRRLASLKLLSPRASGLTPTETSRRAECHLVQPEKFRSKVFVSLDSLFLHKVLSADETKHLQPSTAFGKSLQDILVCCTRSVNMCPCPQLPL